MGIMERLLSGLRAGDAPPAGVRAPAGLARRPRAGIALLWILAGWTALCGLALLFVQGGFSRSVAAGLADGPGQRLLGVQLLALSAVYAFVAKRGAGWLDWLPLAVQAGLAAVIAFDWIAGKRDFAATAFALAVTLLFALLLAAFRLAGDTTLHEPRADVRPWSAVDQPAGVDVQAPTERLTLDPSLPPAVATERVARAGGADAGDDRLLGV